MQRTCPICPAAIRPPLEKLGSYTMLAIDMNFRLVHYLGVNIAPFYLDYLRKKHEKAFIQVTEWRELIHTLEVDIYNLRLDDPNGEPINAARTELRSAIVEVAKWQQEADYIQAEVLPEINGMARRFPSPPSTCMHQENEESGYEIPVLDDVEDIEEAAGGIRFVTVTIKEEGDDYPGIEEV